jgi:uncharacterized protein YciI
MRFFVNLQPGPAWRAGLGLAGQDQAVLLAHLQTMRARYVEGSLVFGGPFRDRDGGMAVMEARDAQHAGELMDRDAAVAAGLLTYQVVPMRPYFDAFSGSAWSE